jgi:hypothetical protein
MIRKLRFIEAGAANRYRKSWKNRFLYNGTICNPSTGLITLATIAKRLVDDTLMYSESISEIDRDDVQGADVVLISINTFNAVTQSDTEGRKHRGTVLLCHLPLTIPNGTPISLTICRIDNPLALICRRASSRIVRKSA